jgi:hypothetical protein
MLQVTCNFSAWNFAASRRYIAEVMMPAKELFSSPRTACKQFAAVLMLLLLLTLQAFGASASLHKLIHADAASPSHECAITLLSSGHVDQPGCPVTPVVPVEFFVVPLTYETPLIFGCDCSVTSSRGPPVLS